MKSKHPERWQKHGHIHLSAADVPWKVKGVGAVNVKSEMGGCDKNAVLEFWDVLNSVAFQGCGKNRSKGRIWVEQARDLLEVKSGVKIIDDRFNLGAVKAFKRLCDRGEGLVRTVLDRDAGQLWLTCPALHSEFGRNHFVSAANKEEWEQWDTDKELGEQPKYWQVQSDSKTVLMKWKREYATRSEKRCGKRWLPWDNRGVMVNARWQYKKKDVGKIRAIFNGSKDPAVKEMAVTAKCISLIKKTVGSSDFSISTGLELGEWLRGAEEQLGEVYGEFTELKVYSTDFKNFFPSNRKCDMVKVLQQAIDLIFSGCVRTGCKVPVNQWITVPRGVKAVALWGRRAIAGSQYRKVQDVVEYLRFRAEIANAFAVGDKILQGEEVIIGEKISPGICELKAMLDEDRLMKRLTDKQRSVVRCTRYVDDGVRVVAVDSRESECASVELVDEIGELIAAAYPGIEVTKEGEANKDGEVVNFLEFLIGVSEDGRSLRWHHFNKNIQSVAKEGVQKFLKLKHWQSGTFNKQLLSTVRARLQDIVLMTRSGGNTAYEQRGCGCLSRDALQSVMELAAELYLTLGYPLRSLVGLIRGMGRINGLWADLLVGLQAMKSSFEDEEDEVRRRRVRWRVIEEGECVERRCERRCEKEDERSDVREDVRDEMRSVREEDVRRR
jgi:hypothetical protein